LEGKVGDSITSLGWIKKDCEEVELLTSLKRSRG